MHGFATMMAIVKDLFSDKHTRFSRRDVAKRLGGAADLARNFGGSAADLAKRGGSSAVDLAKRGGESAAVLAKKVGTKRALIGLAVIGAAVGGIFLVRYLRDRQEMMEDDELQAGEEPGTVTGARNRRQSRAKRKAANATITH